jgi:hypothetical protein
VTSSPLRHHAWQHQPAPPQSLAPDQIAPPRFAEIGSSLRRAPFQRADSYRIFCRAVNKWTATLGAADAVRPASAGSELSLFRFRFTDLVFRIVAP